MDKKQVEELRKLKTLLNEGIISKEEFIEARDNLLHSHTENQDKPTNVVENQSVINDSDDIVVSSATSHELEGGSDDVEATTEMKGADEVATNIEEKKTTEKGTSNKNTIIIIAVVIAVIAAIFGGISASNNAKAQRTREALPGEWVYAESYDNDGKYDAKLDSSIVFTEDGKIEIHIDDCVCKGTWSVEGGSDYCYVFVLDTTVTGKSEGMDEILKTGLSYKEYDDGINLYWYDSTSTHYYKHK